MAEPVSSSYSSSSSSSSSPPGMMIDIRPMIEDVSQVMTKHITTILSGVIGEYTIYKETHDTIMGLPCVRKLQQRISELEHGDGDGGGVGAREVPLAASGANSSNSREDEIAQLQSAIAEMNRYIVALESKVDMKAVCLSKEGGEKEKEKDEESVRLEIHEEDDNSVEESAEVSFTMSSAHKNVIISNTDTTADEAAEEEEEGDGDVEDSDDDAVAAEDEVEEEAAEAEEEAAEAEEEEAEEEEEAAEAEEEEAVVDEEEEEAAEEEEEAAEEEEAEEEEEAAEEEEEAEIEVSEVKIKGKIYFTTDPQNGIIYACVDEDVGDEVGVFKNGVAVFNKGKK